MSGSLAVITARGGSKRIPRKNIKAFYGKPIMAYSILAAIESNCFDIVMVSTDDVEIASIAKSFGAEVPFLRSSEAASDFATTAAVIAEVVSNWADLGRNFEDVCCIYPTAPFVTGEKIRRAYSILIESEASSLISIVRFEYPVQRALRKNGESLVFWMPEFQYTRSQDIEMMYHDAGQFYWIHGNEFLKEGSFITPKTIGFELPETEVQDIDTEADWAMAELKYEVFSKKMNSEIGGRT
jgi:N-acylneuraminate cytidylyltransferase